MNKNNNIEIEETKEKVKWYQNLKEMKGARYIKVQVLRGINIKMNRNERYQNFIKTREMFQIRENKATINERETMNIVSRRNLKQLEMNYN